MAWLKAFLVLALLCFSTGDDSLIPIGPPDTANSSTTTTSSTTKPLNTTTSTSTTSKTTTISTTPPKTTTISTPPPKTTTISTTSKTTTTSTTASPNTTTTTTTSTTPKSTTTAKPPTPQPLTPGKWSANYTNSNNTCLVLEAALQIDLLYKVDNATKNHQINVPPTATATGDCSNKTENITLSFGEGSFITFNIQKSNDTKKYDVESIMVTVKANFPDLNVTQFFLTHRQKEFSTPVSNSYKCTPERKFNLTALDNSSYFGELHLSHFQVQAFRNSTNQKFDEALDCEGSETPDVVPIAVGCALAALVIIVLVAYLIGRRRSQARGYLSMFPQNKREEDYIPMKNLSCFN